MAGEKQIIGHPNELHEKTRAAYPLKYAAFIDFKDVQYGEGVMLRVIYAVGVSREEVRGLMMRLDPTHHLAWKLHVPFKEDHHPEHPITGLRGEDETEVV